MSLPRTRDAVIKYLTDRYEPDEEIQLPFREIDALKRRYHSLSRVDNGIRDIIDQLNVESRRIGEIQEDIANTICKMEGRQRGRNEFGCEGR